MHFFRDVVKPSEFAADIPECDELLTDRNFECWKCRALVDPREGVPFLASDAAGVIVRCRKCPGYAKFQVIISSALKRKLARKFLPKVISKNQA